MAETTITPEKKANNLAEEVAKLCNHPQTIKHATKYGLVIQNISWEDVARDKGSAYGKNITDMTLHQRYSLMPMIRVPNFADVTYDIPIDQFTVTVGNERKLKSNQDKSELTIIPLRTYLDQIAKYTDSGVGSMLCNRDEMILTQVQACVLGGNHEVEAQFTPAIFNYNGQSIDEFTYDPAVMTIMATHQGTSTEALNVHTEEGLLHFNNHGSAHKLLAQTLTRARQESTDCADSKEAPMNDDEKEKNIIFIFQVPLLQKPLPPREYEGQTPQGCAYFAPPKEIIFEDAQLSVGERVGKFHGTDGQTLIRNPNLPIRCTVQFYKIANSIEIPESEFADIARKIESFASIAVAKGSLVTEGATTRTTESTPI